jgi:hypothetical protein
MQQKTYAVVDEAVCETDEQETYPEVGYLSPAVRDAALMRELIKEVDEASDDEVRRKWNDLEAMHWLVKFFDEEADSEHKMRILVVGSEMRRRRLDTDSPKEELPEAVAYNESPSGDSIPFATPPAQAATTVVTSMSPSEYGPDNPDGGDYTWAYWR